MVCVENPVIPCLRIASAVRVFTWLLTCLPSLAAGCSGLLKEIDA